MLKLLVALPYFVLAYALLRFILPAFHALALATAF